jgi:hypothetical protein
LYEAKYTPKVMKDVAKVLDEKLMDKSRLQTGIFGDFVVTRSPLLEKQLKEEEQQPKSNEMKDNKSEAK